MKNPIWLPSVFAGISTFSMANMAMGQSTPDPNVQSAYSFAQADQDYSGDVIHFRHQITVKIVDETGSAIQVKKDDGTSGDATLCLPAMVKLITGPSNSTGVFAVIGTNFSLPGSTSGRIGEARDQDKVRYKTFMSSFPQTAKLACETAPGEEKPSVPNWSKYAHRRLLIKLGDFEDGLYRREGMTYGALVIPYKWHLNGNHDLSASTAIGPYLGYRFGEDFINVTPMIFGGYTSTSSSKTVNGVTSNGTNNGISLGTGVIYEIKNNFQAGLIAGWDLAEKNSGVVDNGRMWVSLAVGYKFKN